MILFQFLFRTRTRTNFENKSAPVHYYVPKNQLFSVPVYFYGSVHGFGNVEVDGFRLLLRFRTHVRKRRSRRERKKIDFWYVIMDGYGFFLKIGTGTGTETELK